MSLLLVALLQPLGARADGTEWSVDGFAVLRAGQVEGRESWTEEGFGKLPVGAEGADESEFFASGGLQAAFDWHPTSRFRAVVHGLARTGTSDDLGRDFGLVEAFLEGRFFFRTADELRLRFGHFFLPTSRENVELLWSSPYTLTWSAVNSWIAEEVRPTGLSTEVRLVLPRSWTLRPGAMVFGGNDTQGAMLAWRGWSLGDRLTVWDEALPLPPLGALEDGRIFEKQRDDGSQPFGPDLDGEPGWAAWLHAGVPDRFEVQWTRVDNRGERGLIDGEYAWETSFDLAGLEAHTRNGWSLVAEWLSGETGMGPRTGPFRRSQSDFEARYLLVSWSRAGWRITARWDDFSVRDRDHREIAVLNDEDGEAWTGAVLWDPHPSLRLAWEAVLLDSDRPEALRSGGEPDTNGLLSRLELRWYF